MEGKTAHKMKKKIKILKAVILKEIVLKSIEIVSILYRWILKLFSRVYASLKSINQKKYFILHKPMFFTR